MEKWINELFKKNVFSKNKKLQFNMFLSIFKIKCSWVNGGRDSCGMHGWNMNSVLLYMLLM